MLFIYLLADGHVDCFQFGAIMNNPAMDIRVQVFFFKLFKKFIYLFYLFLAMLGLRCCAQAFSSCGERGLLFVAVRRLLIALSSLVAEHGL